MTKQKRTKIKTKKKREWNAWVVMEEPIDLYESPFVSIGSTKNEAKGLAKIIEGYGKEDKLPSFYKLKRVIVREI